MDNAQLSELRRWAERMRDTGRDQEMRAAGRAILMLADELERRGESSPVARAASEAPAPPRERTRRRDASGIYDFESDPDGAETAAAAAAEDEPRDDDEEPPAPRSRTGSGGAGGWFRRALGLELAEEEPERYEDERAQKRRLEARKRKRKRYRRLGLAVVVLGALIFATFALGAKFSRPSLHAEGPAQNALLGPRQLQGLGFAIRSSPGDAKRALWLLDGIDVSRHVLTAGDTATFPATDLADGAHVLSVSIDGGFPGANASHDWHFTVDTTAPKLGIPARVPIQVMTPVRLSGTVEPDARLAANGHPLAVRGGRFTLALRSVPATPVTFVARDKAGNASRTHVTVVQVPRSPGAPIRAVHVTIDAWATPSLRNPVLQLLAEHRIDAVELDLKDESAKVGWNAPIPLARKIGALRVTDGYDLAAAVRLLHSKGARVIGRIVAFRDSVLATWAWANGHHDWVVQTPAGGPYSGYGGFTNFANPVVRRYNTDIAVAAARAGVDEILYDYVRRPDGPISSMVFPGLKGTPEASIASFLGQVRAALPRQTYLGASVFGVAATRPTEVAQDIPAIARHVDYVAPMVYPSHWGPGEYQVANPNAEPYQIVQRSLKDFQADVAGTGARVVPWLQDFSLGVTYGPTEVRAQINGAHDDGIDEFVLWDPAVTYDSAALTPMGGGKPTTNKPTTTSVGSDELGSVPVLMVHQILDHPGAFDQTPQQFRSLIARIYRDGYVPVTAGNLVDGKIDVPAGKSPIVLTFDDSTNSQIKFLPDGTVDPNSAVGMLQAFAKAHPDFHPTATFFVLRDAFTGSGKPSNEILRWLVQHGYELADHTKDHLPLGTLSDVDVQREIVLGARVIHAAVPGYKIRTLALPLGSVPKTKSLGQSGSWGGESYHFGAVFNSGAEPDFSPYSTKFDGSLLPRIAVLHDQTVKFGANYWLTYYEQHPSERFVSDGDPTRVSLPSRRLDELAQRWQSSSNAY